MQIIINPVAQWLLGDPVGWTLSLRICSIWYWSMPLMEKGCTNKPHVVLVIFHDFPVLGCFTLFHHPFFHLPGLHPGPSLGLLLALRNSWRWTSCSQSRVPSKAAAQPFGLRSTGAPRLRHRNGSDAAMPRWWGVKTYWNHRNPYDTHSNDENECQMHVIYVISFLNPLGISWNDFWRSMFASFGVRAQQVTVFFIFAGRWMTRWWCYDLCRGPPSCSTASWEHNSGSMDMSMAKPEILLLISSSSSNY